MKRDMMLRLLSWKKLTYNKKEMKQDIEVASIIERDKVIQELHVAYKIHKDAKHYIISSAAIQEYAVPLLKLVQSGNQSKWHG